jgi:hypothetical protein
MYATVHAIADTPGPQDISWVDAVLAALRARAVPAGALVAAPMDLGPGTVVALWDDEADAAAAPSGPAGPVTLGPGRRYQVDLRKAGAGPGPARYLQLLTFDGPRDAAWSAAYDRAGEERIWPSARDCAGVVEVLGGRTADGGRVNAVAAASVEALEDVARAILSTPLLPGEDPAQLTGPDAMAIQRLLHADLPVGADR